MKHVGFVLLGILSVVGIPLIMLLALIFALYKAGKSMCEVYEEYTNE